MNSPVSAHDELWLRSRFAEARPVKPVTEGDGHLGQRDRESRSAAVLVPVVKRKHGLTVLFTRRTAHLNDQAGQISFPGGRSEPGDADAAETALREAAEEIGLTAAQVEVLGGLHDYVTVTGYRVTPVVGLVTPPLELRLHEFDVAEVFEVPLEFLLDPANQLSKCIVHAGRERRYYAIPYRRYYIWGATAGMLMNLDSFLKG